jgi:hypothetical protein
MGVPALILNSFAGYRAVPAPFDERDCFHSRLPIHQWLLVELYLFLRLLTKGFLGCEGAVSSDQLPVISYHS